MSRATTAMILAAGLGTRMGPLTERRAKPALRLFDLPLIAWPMASLAGMGVERLVVNVHHFPETLEPELVHYSRHLGLDLRISRESEQILGTGGGLRAAAPLLLEAGPGGTMLLLNADSIFLGDLEAACEAHQGAGREASMLLQPPPDKGRYGVVQTAADGRVISIVGEPESAETPVDQWMFIGIHLFEPALLRRIPEGVVDINTGVYRGMIRSGQAVGGVPVSGSWLDFGTPRQFLRSALILMEGQTVEGDGLTLPLKPPGRFEAAGPSYVGPEVERSPTARLNDVVLGGGGTVAAGCRLTRCLLMEGCRLGDSVTLEDCLVGPGTVIPEGFEARGELLSCGLDGGPPERRPLGEV